MWFTTYSAMQSPWAQMASVPVVHMYQWIEKFPSLQECDTRKIYLCFEYLFLTRLQPPESWHYRGFYWGGMICPWMISNYFLIPYYINLGCHGKLSPNLSLLSSSDKYAQGSTLWRQYLNPRLRQKYAWLFYGGCSPQSSNDYNLWRYNPTWSQTYW